MTIISAFHKPGYGTVIGSDSQIICGNRKRFTPNGKWTIGPYWATGSSGPARLRELIEINRDTLLVADITPFEFSRKVREILIEDKLEPCKGNSEPSLFKIDIALASPHGLYQVGSDGHSSQEEWVSLGCGEDFAAGAAHILRQQGASPEDIVYSALSTAIKYDVSCGGKVWMHLLPSGPNVGEAPRC